MLCKRAIYYSGATIQRERGVALAILVWFIGAMSLLVAGIMMQARVDIKLAQQHATKAKAEALADGAIALAMAQVSVLESRGEFFSRNQHVFEQPIASQTVLVYLTPVAGLIDLNLASEEMLVQMLMGSANIDENVARELAANMVEWRSPGAGDEEDRENVRYSRFEAVEDILLVPGIDREIFEAVRDSTYVSQRGQGTVDWLSAPIEVLQTLGMNDEEAMEYAQQRVGDDAPLVGLPEAIDPAFFGSDTLPGYRVDAVVNLDDSTYMRRRGVDRSRTGLDGLPWHFFRTEPMIAVSSDSVMGVVMQESFDDGN